MQDEAAVAARVGAAVASRDRRGQRCESLPSTSMSVTGQVCSKARYLRDDPAPQSSAYARAAGAYYADHSWLSEYVSELELRINFENLVTDDAKLDIHLLLFAVFVLLIFAP